MERINKDERRDRIADDLLRGATAIGRELGWSRRQIFHAHERGLLPTFAVGRAICARRSSLREHFTALERRRLAAEETTDAP